MPSAAGQAAKKLVDGAIGGVVRRGHLGIYQKLKEALEAARERLAGREELLQFDTIRQALDAKVEELTAALRDPSVADHVAISEGVYELLNACQPLYLAINDGLSVKDACDALNEAYATLDHFADEDAAYDKYRKLNGGWIRDHGKWVKLNAKEFATWQEKNNKSKQNFKQNPYKDTKQTTAGHEVAFRKERKTKKKHGDATHRKTKKARRDDDEPTPPGLDMRVTGSKGAKSKKYCVTVRLFEYAPKKTSNPYTTKEKAMELAELCLANRPAGRTRVEQQAARAQKGLKHGVVPRDGGFKVFLSPKKKTNVTLAAPGGGSLFDTAAAAAKAIKKYEDAGSPTNKTHPLVHLVYRY
jgi:hypothetical protein